MKTIKDLLKEHHFFKDLDTKDMRTIAGCGQNIIFKKGEMICREDEPADMFYIIRTGKVTIDIHAPGQGNITIQTIQEGDVLGFSWIIPPYKWRFNARVVDEVHVVALDGKCLRGKCEEDHHMGYELLKRFSSVLAQRLEMTRLQLLDIYGVKAAKINL